MRTFLLWLCLTAWAAAQPLTLDDAVQRALQTSPSVRRLEFKTQEAVYGKDEAAAPGNLRADASLRYFRMTPELGFQTPAGSLPIVVSDNWVFAVSVEQALLTFGRLEWGKEVSRLAHLATLEDLAREKEKVVYRTRLLYGRLAVTRQGLDVYRSRLASRKALVHDLDLRVKAGTSAAFERLVAEVACAEDERKLLEWEQKIAVLKGQLAVLLGLPEDDPLQLAGLPEVVPPQVDGAMEQALAVRPELRALDQLIQSAEARVSYEDSQDAPELGAFSRYEQRTATAFQTGNAWAVGLQLKVPLWDGGLTEARTNKVRAALEQVRQGRREAERQVRLEVRDALSRLALSQEALRVARTQQKKAEEAQRLGQLRFQVGVGTHQEVLDVQAHTAEAGLAVLEAEQGWREAVWELELARSSASIPAASPAPQGLAGQSSHAPVPGARP